MCPEALILSTWFDKELSAEKHAQVSEHVKKCPSCQEIVKNFTKQRTQLYSQFPSVEKNGNYLQKFWTYMGIQKLHKSYIPRHISLPIPVVAVLLVSLAFASIMNFIPFRKNSQPAPMALEQHSYTPTVISLTITPSEIDTLFTLLEGVQGLSGETLHLLPVELPTSQFGKPQIFPATTLDYSEGSP